MIDRKTIEQFEVRGFPKRCNNCEHLMKDGWYDQQRKCLMNNGPIWNYKEKQLGKRKEPSAHYTETGCEHWKGDR